MALFNLSQFIQNLTFEQIDTCRKDELLMILQYPGPNRYLARS